MSITQSLPSRTSESPGLFRSSSGFSMIWRIFLCIYPDKTALRKSSYLDRHLSVLRVSDVLQTSIDAGVQLIVLTCGALFNFNICSLIFEMMGWGKLIFKPLLIFSIANCKSPWYTVPYKERFRQLLPTYCNQICEMGAW